MLLPPKYNNISSPFICVGSGAPIQVVQLSGTTPCELEKEEDNSEPKKQSKGSTKQPWHYHLGTVS
jgi:hypothetical protein